MSQHLENSLTIKKNVTTLKINHASIPLSSYAMRQLLQRKYKSFSDALLHRIIILLIRW